jgi:preprotein translocase subunit SecA
MFEDLIGNIQSTVAARIFRIQPVMRQQSSMPQNIHLGKANSQSGNLTQAIANNPLESNKKIGQSTQASGNTSDLAKILASGRKSTMTSNNNQVQTQINPAAKAEKIGRNDPCPCGSGLKYKKCGLLGKCEVGGQV